MSPPVVQVQNLAFSYGTHKALGGISFEVAAGEIFGLLGPNGGGKTTAFRILATLLRASAGHASVFGIDVNEGQDAIRRRIGVVFQNPSLDRQLTVRENLTHQGHLYGLRGAGLRERIETMLQRLGVSDRSESIVETLSGGLARRVELARGLLHNPSLLILDEPSTGLDPGARRDLWQYLQSLQKQGTTVLLTTHLIEEADRCDRVLILNRGGIVALGTPGDLKEQIGGDVIAITSSKPEELRLAIDGRFGISGQVIDSTVRFERPRGHEFIARLIEAFPGMVDSVTVSKPTLEDVFIDRTGHRFWEDQ